MELDLNTNFTRCESIQEFHPIKTIPFYAWRSFGFCLDPAPILPSQDPPGPWKNLLPFITEGGGGLRPAATDRGASRQRWAGGDGSSSRRVAAAGYYVMLPNLYYRDVPSFTVHREDPVSTRYMAELMGNLSNAMVAADAKALILSLIHISEPTRPY